MNDTWKRAVTPEETSLGDALQVLDESSLGIVLAVDNRGRLKGVATDGDIRRAILRGEGLDASLGTALNHDPVVADPRTDREQLLRLMRDQLVHQVPLVSADGTLQGVATIDSLAAQRRFPNPVVIMAGGRGRRLHPLTEEVPKPLVTVQGQPLLRRVLDAVALQGFHDVAIAIHYKAEMIREYVGDGSRWGLNVTYLEEDEPLGTAGALSLLPSPPSAPVLLMNADVMTTLDLSRLVDDHASSSAAVTMVLRDHVTEIPFGVVEVRHDGSVANIEEKPRVSSLINAGVYVIEPCVIEGLVSGRRIDMTELIEQCLADNLLVRAHETDEYWIDVGRLSDLHRARRELPRS